MILLDGAVIEGEQVTTKSITVAANTNRKLVVSFSTYQGSGPTSVTADGIALTKVAEKIGSFGEQCSHWELVNPNTGTYNVVFSGVSNWYAYGIYKLYNAKQSISTNFNSANGNSSSASVSLTTLVRDSWVLATIEAEPTITITTSGATTDWNEQGLEYQHGAGAHILKATPGAQSMAGSLGYSARWNAVSVEVEAALGVSPSASSSPSISPSSSTSPSASESPSASLSPSASASASVSPSASESPSASVSPSSSASSSASASQSPSASVSPSSSTSASRSPSSSQSPSSSLSASPSPSAPPTGLIYKGIDTMGWTKDLLDNPKSETAVNNHIAAIASNLNVNIIAIAIPMNTNAQALAARGSNFGIDPALYAQRFMDAIHNNGKKVLFRGTDCEFEEENGTGLYGFSYIGGGRRNGNRYTFFGDPITDDFSSTGTRSHGYGKTSAAGNLSSNYLTSHQSGNDWTIVSGELTGPAANGWVRTCLFNANYLRNVTLVAKVKKVGNQQIIVRATTNQNFPGYGLQLRAGEVRIERPGLANLGSVSKTLTENSYYWMKLDAQGSTIRGKVWLDGTSEPGSWDISITDTTYTSGYCGFSGESSFGKFDSMTITPGVDTDTWTYRAGNWIRTNIALFQTGDQVVPFPEASSHASLTNEGDYNQFFMDLSYVLTKIGTDNGKTLQTNVFSHIWTSTIQNTYNTQFDEFGIATYDHYGASLGLNRRFLSAQQGSVSGSAVYSLTSALNEGATHKCSFFPEKLAFNETIDVQVVDKGTGDWTMEIHDASNNRVQMCSHTNFANKTTTGIVTIPNASLVNGQLNTFTVQWDNPAPDVLYHFHLYSSDGTGTVLVSTGTSLANCVFRQYKCTATPEAIEIDIRKTYSRTGHPQYLQEWGDYWSTDASRSSPVRTQAEHEAYLDSMYEAFQRLVDDGILIGFNYWRAVGSHEGVMSADGLSLLYEGVKLQEFFAANTISASASVSPSASSSASRSPSSSASSSASSSISASTSPSASVSPSSSTSPSSGGSSVSASISPSSSASFSLSPSASVSASPSPSPTWRYQRRHILT